MMQEEFSFWALGHGNPSHMTLKQSSAERAIIWGEKEGLANLILKFIPGAVAVHVHGQVATRFLKALPAGK